MIASTSIIVVVLPVLGAIGLSALLALALGRAAARGDADLEDRLRRAREERRESPIAASHESYAGLARAQRLPVRAATSRTCPNRHTASLPARSPDFDRATAGGGRGGLGGRL